MKAKKKNFTTDYIRAARKASRDEEILLHGKPLRRTKIQKSAKAYDRKKLRADLAKGRSFFIPGYRIPPVYCL